MSSVTSFFLKKILATPYETSVQLRMKFIGAETQADLEVQYGSCNNSSAEFQHCDCDTGMVLQLLL